QWNQRILEQIDDRTSVVLLSSAHWMNGLRFDLKAIGQRCREVGAKFLVDGTQSVGVLPIDVQDLHIDALICATYKWLLG
ncbi:MAG: aminotransferase class V-fold PLP-dependent enzyme, partial [Saprospiraceae bacterium]|nr:aminotransferase class V-fold PLP-dependent enzyme [Saprospiraceae bacterium]